MARMPDSPPLPLFVACSTQKSCAKQWMNASAFGRASRCEALTPPALSLAPCSQSHVAESSL
eukprot:365455-Chlamydomonas_euryale.AAC.22